MKPLSDEILVAYADDELAPPERAAVERRLAHDADARDRLAAFTSTGQWLARAYDDTLRASPPDDLVRAIRAAAGGAAASTGTAVLQPRRTLWQRLRAADWSLMGPGMGGVGVGLAAGVALMLAMPGSESGAPDEERLIAAALETAASGEPHLAELPDGRLEITPIGTVRTGDGSVCREFTEIRETGTAAPVVTHGLACRTSAPEATAAWQTVARIDLTPASTEGPGFALASGDPQAVFEALLAALGEPEVLSPEEERERLREGWQ
jgi:hypothetical protein